MALIMLDPTSVPESDRCDARRADEFEAASSPHALASPPRFATGPKNVGRRTPRHCKRLADLADLADGHVAKNQWGHVPL